MKSKITIVIKKILTLIVSQYESLKDRVQEFCDEVKPTNYRKFDLSNYSGQDLAQVKALKASQVYEIIKQILKEKRNSDAIDLVMQAENGKNKSSALKALGKYLGYKEFLELPDIADYELKRRAKSK